ncbi:MAG: hypothetical protein H7Y36_05880 [Armatimonadetes bacterium]|nr:hypothetical protein [Akkermansiaceae bacterium]
MKSISLSLLTIISSLLVMACEDPALVKQRGEQEAEIAKLRGELALVQERLKNLPPDQSNELDAATVESERLEQQHKQLTEEVAKLEAEHKQLQQQYEAYQAKYDIR